MVVMKLISFNVIRLGGWEKHMEVLKLVREMCLSALCLHETKLEVVDDLLY